jgi:hypothetical protein
LGRGLRDVRDGLAVLDAFNEQQAAMEREAGITVRHEDLSVFVKRQTPHQPKVLTYVKPSPTSRPSTPRPRSWEALAAPLDSVHFLLDGHSAVHDTSRVTRDPSDRLKYWRIGTSSLAIRHAQHLLVGRTIVSHLPIRASVIDGLAFGSTNSGLCETTAQASTRANVGGEGQEDGCRDEEQKWRRSER